MANDNEMSNDVLMQNLYDHIGAKPTDDDEEIKKKIKKKRTDLEAVSIDMDDDEAQKLRSKAKKMLDQAEKILLNPENRKDYDNALNKQTLSISDPANTPANQANQQNQYYLAPGHDISEVIKEFEKFVNENGGVVDKVGSEMSADDQDRLEAGAMKFSMDTSQPGVLKLSFPNEGSASQFINSVLKQGLVTKTAPGVQQSQQNQQSQDQNQSADKKGPQPKPGKVEEDDEQENKKEDQERLTKVKEEAAEVKEEVNEEDASAGKLKSPGAIPTLTPPGSK